MKSLVSLVLMCTVAGASTIVHAGSCDKLRDDIEITSGLINRAQEAKSFNDAKRAMHSAKFAMNQIAEDARDCPCMDAADLFDDAATKISRASDADVVGRYNDFSKQGVQLYGAAIDALNSCIASQKSPQ